MHLSIKFNFEKHFRVPTVEIGIDSISLYKGQVQSNFEFYKKLQHGEHLLWIRHYGKSVEETTQQFDTHIFVKEVRFEDINLDQFDHSQLTHLGRFYPEYNENYVKDCKIANIDLPEFICPNHYLGHNGTWKLNFESPCLDWIIKNQNPSGINLEDTIFSSGNESLEKIKDLFNL